MFNKNDPLIGAVQQVMFQSEIEREVAKIVNEAFGIEDRKALPHEYHAEWDYMYNRVLAESDDMGPVNKKENESQEYQHKTSGKRIRSTKNPGKDWELCEGSGTLHPNQRPLDMNKNEKLDSQDFKMLRAMRAKKKVNEASFPGAPSVKMPRGMAPSSKHEKSYNDHHSELKSLADSGKINTPAGKKQASVLIDRIQALVDKHLPGSLVPSKKIWLGEQMKDPNSRDVTSPSSTGIKKPNYAPAGTIPDYAKPTTQTVNRAEKTSLPPGTLAKSMKEEATKEQKAKIAKVMHKWKQGKENIGKSDKTVPVTREGQKQAVAIALSQAGLSNKKKVDEGFNNRHGLSVTASAGKKQTVAVLNEEDIDSYENRMTAGLGQQNTPYGGGRFGGGNAKTGTLARRPVRIDPGLRNINTRTGEQIKTSSGPKTRKRVVPKKKSQEQQAVQQQGPAKPPGGTFLDNLVKARRNVGMDRPAANLAAGVARRPATTSNVPLIRQTTSSSGSNLPQRPWGGINRRGGARNPISSTSTAGGARRPAGQSAPPMRQQGSMLPPPKSTGIIRRGGARGAAGLATGAALELATSSTPVDNKPPQSIAGVGTPNDKLAPSSPEKIKTSTQTTTTQPDYDKMTFGQAFKSAREQAGGASGKFKYRGKEYQTNIQGTGTAKKPQEKYLPANKLKTVAPAPVTKTSTSVVGGQGVAAVPGGASKMAAKSTPSASSSPAFNVQPARNSTLAAPSATAATTMSTATKAAGQMAVDRMKAQNLAKSQTSSMFGGSVNKPKPFDQFQDKGRYAGDMRSTKSSERIANPSFVPRPSPGAPGVIRTPSKTFGGPK